MTINTERLVLRDFVESDWSAVLAYHSDPRYQCYYPPMECSETTSQEFVAMFLAQQRVCPRIKFQLAITLADTGQLIGNCGLRLDHVDADNGDIGFELSPDQWGNGYATEAARAMVRFGYVELRLRRIWARCIADNVKSMRILENIGMRLDERLKDDACFNGRFWDSLIFGQSADEWQRQNGK
ncbi:MAG: GNAT family protein [Verrucomicrobia bacterium]|nr:GNAT family protein [Verrucomicrobiota bacterium]